MARVNLSLALFYAQDLQGAAREATEAARLLPSAPQPPYMLGLIARAENRTMRRGVRTRPSARPERRRHERQPRPDDLEQRQYAEAIAILQPVVAGGRYNVTAAYNLGLALTRSGGALRDGGCSSGRRRLRSTGYAVTYGTGYLEQGRYAEALASTGAEPELVEPATRQVCLSVLLDGVRRLRRRGRPTPRSAVASRARLDAAGARAIAAGSAVAWRSSTSTETAISISSSRRRRWPAPFRNDGDGRGPT